MHLLERAARWFAAILLWTVVALCLTATVLPQFLDRIYYRGAESAHYDGQRFFNPDGEGALLPPGGGSRAGLIWRQLFGDSTRPVWPDRVAVAPSKPPARVGEGEMLVTWVGHATLLVQADGLNILTDPIWSERAGPLGVGPARVAEPGIRFEDLPRIDLVLVSHNHYDHMDLATLKRLWARDKPLIVTSLGNDSVIGQAGVPSRALDWGRSVYHVGGKWVDVRPRECAPRALCGFPSVTVTRNHHWGSRWFRDRNRALWSSFVVGLPHGNFFFAGDTGIGDGKWPAEAAAFGPIRLAAIPVGAFRFVDKQMGTDSHIGPRDAIAVWESLGRPRAIPIHWGTFRLSREAYWTPPRLLRAMLRCAGGDAGQFASVMLGATTRIAPLGAQARAPAPDLAAIDRCTESGRFDAIR